MGRSLGYGDAEMLLRVRFPAALPEIFTGIRIGTGTALLATIAAEMLAGSTGLGALLFDAGFSMRTAEMFGLMLLIGLSGVLLNGLLGIVRRLMIGWHMGLMPIPFDQAMVPKAKRNQHRGEPGALARKDLATHCSVCAFLVPT